MKKIILILTILFVGLLSACQLYEDSTFEELSLDDALFYNFKTATFNNTSSQDLIHGIHDYPKEFFRMYLIVLTREYISNDIYGGEYESYEALFVKLELLDKHDEEIFTMSSDEFEELFNDTDIEITANDILVFESINNMFAKLEGKTVPLATVDFIDTVIEGNLQSEEHDSLVYLYTIYNELATEYNVLLNLDDPIGDFILLIENTSGKQLEQTEIDDLTVAYNLLNQLN